jgi:hypothetical protein
MKHLFLLAMICSMNCFSQNANPDLFQTWYLVNVQGSDLSPLYTVSSISPSITPTLTIYNTFEFEGVGACNTFNGAYTNVTDSSWNYGSFSQSDSDCGNVIHNQFEDNYFSFFQTFIGFYQIYSDGTGQVLSMQNPIFGGAVFRNYQLNTNDRVLEQIKIYPNPSKSVIYCNANQLEISKIQIINSLGQNVKTKINDFDVIDISELSPALYSLKIETEKGTVYKKIIKQ